MRILLHTCCGPCASACVPRLKDDGHEVTMLFANSNIDTREEFEKRLHEAEKLAAVEGVRLVSLPYDHAEWLREVAAGYEHEPEKGARCARCFRYNLAKAAAYAAEHGMPAFTTSLTVSPHKVTQTIFDSARTIVKCPNPPSAIPGIPTTSFICYDFKKCDGFKLSTRRTRELGLYRQGYCGCEFSKWRVHHRTETVSTNLDARTGSPFDVFTADYQTAGRGRLDHRWLSPPGQNLMMSAVLPVVDLAPDHIATLPLLVGLATVAALQRLSAFHVPFSTSRPPFPISLKWPNDVLIGSEKVAGILCERQGDNVIVGIGVNVNQTDFPPEISDRATSVSVLLRRRSGRLSASGQKIGVRSVRNAVLGQLGKWYGIWRERGFAAAYPEIVAVDCLKGRTVSVRQTDGDTAPASGVSGGIMPDGSLDVGGTRVYAGEAHVERTWGKR